ncbi:YfhO family protein [Georgenia yuyongxinii]|uniref:YfhO family protein n=1 Tax=Georgenia yuyongxinii TaxID=2589797 RepID=A0A552WLR3_9MICO|nr:YfhO family protein [Georgenia yuyongxinii]TRW43589.1 YfhO family protein [Georgenia yuyongxinii]
MRSGQDPDHRARDVQRDPARWTAWLAPVLLVVVLLGPSLLGLRLFAAGDLIERRAPWAETSTVEQVVNTCVSDTIDASLPHQLVYRDRLAAGDPAPLWDNYASAGTILAAAPFQGVVSPIFQATLAMPDAAFQGWIKLFEVAAILAGTVLWARRVGLSVPAGVVGGFLYATGSFMVMWTNWPQTRTAAFFPLLFWAMERLVQDRTVRSALPLPLVVAAIVLGGFPAIAVHAVYLAAAYAVVRLVVLNRTAGRAARGGPWERWGRAPLLAAGGGAVALLLVGFQVVPWAQQLLGTVDLERRANAWTATIGPREILTIAYPQALGTCHSGDARWGSYIPVEGISFVGAGAVVLCLAAVVLPVGAWLSRGVRTFLLVGGLVALAATFLGGPLNYLLQLLPLMGGSGLHRMRAVGGLMLAMLAAVGFDAVARSAGQGRWWRWLAVAAGPVLLGVAAWATYFVAPGPQEWQQVRGTVLLGLLCGAGVALAWAWAMAPRVRWRAVAVAAIPVLLAVDGLTFAHAMWPRVDPELAYRETSTDGFLRANLGRERLVGVHSAYWGGAGQVHGLRSLSGHTFTPEEWRALLLEADPGMFASATSHSLSTLGALEGPVMDRFAVRYGVADTTMVPLGSFWGDGEQDAARSVVLHDAVAARAVPAGTPLRGAVVELVESTGDVQESGETGRLVAQAVAADGRVLAESSRRLRDHETGTVTVAVAGEHLAATTEPYTVTVRAEGGDDLEVRAAGPSPDQQGAAWAGVIVAPDDGLTLVRTADAQVYERESVLPRFRWASGAETCETAVECAALMADVAPTTVLLTGSDAAAHAFDGAPAVVLVEQDEDDLQRVRVTADGAGMLVVADGFQDDWAATVDGREVPIVRADHAMKGVPVPAGEHVIELAYRPVGWGVGPWVAGATVLALAAAWVWLARRDRRAARRDGDAARRAGDATWQDGDAL